MPPPSTHLVSLSGTYAHAHAVRTLLLYVIHSDDDTYLDLRLSPPLPLPALRLARTQTFSIMHRPVIPARALPLPSSPFCCSILPASNFRVLRFCFRTRASALSASAFQFRRFRPPVVVAVCSVSVAALARVPSLTRLFSLFSHAVQEHIFKKNLTDSDLT